MPRTLRHYELMRLLGKGGMGEVWLAWDQEHHREVAIKLLIENEERQVEAEELFAQEVRAASTLEHPRLVNVLDGGREAGEYFMVMELVDGQPLDQLLQAQPSRKLPFPVAVFITGQVLEGLNYLHANGMLHRDVKPPNVMITREGQVKLADFGIMSSMHDETKAKHLVGTPSFMAPELLQQQPFDQRSDLFSVGVLLFELLVGINPFATGQVTSTMGRILSYNPPPVYTYDATIPFEMQKIIDSLIAKDPIARFERGLDATEALKAFTVMTGYEFYPAEFKTYLDSPNESSRQVRESAAAMYLPKLKERLGLREIAAHDYSVGVYQVSLLDPGHDEAKAELETILLEGDIQTQIPNSTALVEMGQAYAAEPENHGILESLLAYYTKHHLFFQAYAIGRAVLRIKPEDKKVRKQVDSICSILSPPTVMDMRRMLVDEADRQKALEKAAEAKKEASPLGDIERFLLERAAQENRLKGREQLAKFKKIGIVTALTGAITIVVVMFIPVVWELYRQPQIVLAPSGSRPVPNWLAIDLLHGFFIRHNRDAIEALPPVERRILYAAEEFVLRQEYARGLQTYTEFVEAYPRLDKTGQEARFNLGVLYQINDAPEEAIATLQPVADNQRTNELLRIETYRAIAEISLSQKNYDAALDAYRSMTNLALVQTLPIHEQVMGYLYDYAAALREVGNYTSAEQIYRDMLKRLYRPDVRAQVYREIGEMYIGIGDPEAFLYFLMDVEKALPANHPDHTWAVKRRYEITGGSGTFSNFKQQLAQPQQRRPQAPAPAPAPAEETAINPTPAQEMPTKIEEK